MPTVVGRGAGPVGAARRRPLTHRYRTAARASVRGHRAVAARPRRRTRASRAGSWPAPIRSARIVSMGSIVGAAIVQQATTGRRPDVADAAL